MPLILIILVIAFCLSAVSDGINTTWGRLWASDTKGKISLEVTDVETEEDAVQYTIVVTNDDWHSHSICFGAEGSFSNLLLPQRTSQLFFWLELPTGKNTCQSKRIWGNSSQEITLSLEPWPFHRFAEYKDDVISAMRRGDYEYFDACVSIDKIDGAYLSDLGWGLGNVVEHCAQFTGPQ